MKNRHHQYLNGTIDTPASQKTSVDSKESKEIKVQDKESKNRSEKKEVATDIKASLPSKSKQAPLAYNPFERMGIDLHKIIFAFLLLVDDEKDEKKRTNQDIFHISLVCKYWNLTVRHTFWSKCTYDLTHFSPKGLDTRIFTFLQIVQNNSQVKFQELNAFIITCFKSLDQNEKNRYLKMASKVTDDQYELLKAIAECGTETRSALVPTEEKEKIEEHPKPIKKFMAIIKKLDFNVNYMVCFISPLLVAELFPNTFILQQLRELNAKLIPAKRSQRILEIDEYVSNSLKALVGSPVIVDIIVRHVNRNHVSFKKMIETGLLHNKPLTNAVVFLAKTQAEAPTCLDTVDHVFEDAEDPTELRSYSADSESDEEDGNYQLSDCRHMKLLQNIGSKVKFGNHSVNMLKQLLPADFVYADEKSDGFNDTYVAMKSVSQISVHLFKVFLKHYQISCLTFNDFGDLFRSASLDCLVELANRYPKEDPNEMRHWFLKNSIFRLIDQKELEKDYENFSRLAFGTYEQHLDHLFTIFRQLLQSIDFLSAKRRIACDYSIFGRDINPLDDVILSLHPNKHSPKHRLFLIKILIELLKNQEKRSAHHFLPGLSSLDSDIKLFLIKEILQIQELRHLGIRMLIHTDEDVNVLQKLLSDNFSETEIHTLLELNWWLNKATVVNILLPKIPLNKYPDFLTSLFERYVRDQCRDDRGCSFAIIMLQQRGDFSPIKTQRVLDYLIDSSDRPDREYLFRLAIIHPGSQVKELSFPQGLEQKKWLMGCFNSRCAIDKAEDALRSGNVVEADMHFKIAREYDSELVDFYLQQVLEKFRGCYPFTDGQRKQLCCMAFAKDCKYHYTLSLLKKELGYQNNEQEVESKQDSCGRRISSF